MSASHPIAEDGLSAAPAYERSVSLVWTITKTGPAVHDPLADVHDQVIQELICSTFQSLPVQIKRNVPPAQPADHFT